MAKAGSILKKSFKIYLIFAGIFLSFFVLWTILGLPIFIDRICIRSEAPIEAAYIVCLGGGITGRNLPSDDGWGRIYTAVQLYLDGYGKKVVFTGGGSGRVSEAEVYSEAARWLGLGDGDAVLDPGPNQTSDHPKNILMIEGAGIGRETPLDIVTSPLHSKRTALCFIKAGFTNFRLVTSYRAIGRRTVEGRIVSRYNAAEYLRDEKKSVLPAFKQSDKTYNDVFMRLNRRSAYFFTALREIAALAAYKIKGLI